MTDQELVDSMNALTADARAVLQAIQTYATVNQDVTFTLSGGTSVTVQSVPKQVAQFNTQFAADKLAFTKDFGGQVTAQAVTRNTAGQITGVTTTLSSGWQIIQAFTYDATTGNITTVTYTIKDNLGATQAGPTVKTINYVNGLFSSVS